MPPIFFLKIKLHKQEIFAYLAAIVALAYGWHCCSAGDADPIGRAGSVVIVCGVLLASSRKIELLPEKVKGFLQDYAAREPDLVRGKLRRATGKEAVDGQPQLTQEELFAEFDAAIKDLVEKRKRVFKMHELILVVGGTLINGLGAWMLKTWVLVP